MWPASGWLARFRARAPHRGAYPLAFMACKGARVKERPAGSWQQGQGLGDAVRLMGAGLRHELVSEVDD